MKLKKFKNVRYRNRRIYWTVISSVALSCGGTALAQTNDVAAANAGTSGNSTNVTQLGETTVVGKLDQARNQIVPNLGATAYAVSKTQISAQAQGENAPFNQVLARTPGMAQDSLGQLHLRGEHANVQYRINDVVLPEGITGFGPELDARFVEDLQLITGSLPAQYGYRTAGIVDIHTKSGAFEPGGQVSMYGGSYDTFSPSASYGGSEGKLNYFVDGSYMHNGIGIENPTSSTHPIHDDTDQYKMFTYLSYVIDDTSRISVMGSASYSDFQLPNTPGLPAGNLPTMDNPGAVPWSTFLPVSSFDSKKLDENQNEQNYYGVVAYQKSVDKFNLQVAGYGRYSGVKFMPDPLGDLFFDGVASKVDHHIVTGGLQIDASYDLTEKNTIRGGLMILDEFATANSTTTVFPTDSNGNPTGSPFPITDNHTAQGQFYGFYMQDEWKILPKVTLNFGGRFDIFNSDFDNETQFSPRINLIYQPFKTTTLHVGYAHYFTPPPLENLSASSVALFDGTSNESEVKTATAAKAETADYFDAGITQTILPGLQVGVDGYYKKAHNQLDDGLFGQSLILTSFNYREGIVKGVEFTASYTKNNFSTYANIAVSQAQGKDVVSGQYLFSSDDLNYISHHWVALDHDQLLTGSFGASYLFQECAHQNTRVYVDALYGSGLRTDKETSTGTIPNGASVPSYYSVNLGAEHTIKLSHNTALKARLDVVNVTDNVYELRDGGGIGVNAAQFGMRRGFFGTLSFEF